MDSLPAVSAFANIARNDAGKLSSAILPTSLCYGLAQTRALGSC